jgi:serine/threonine protein kinase
VIASDRVLTEEEDKGRLLGPYEVFREVARGALASVHLGRLQGAPEPKQTVAIKRLYPVFAGDPEFVATFTEQARLIAHVHHANVLPIVDVVSTEGELLLVQDYMVGESLSNLLRAAGKQRIAMPRRVFVTIMVGVLSGLEAAHETHDERGTTLPILHGDLSPHDILIGLGGVPKVSNFGLSVGPLRERGKAESAQIRGKHAYMSPEQLRGDEVDRRTDVYSAGIILWEGLTGRRLFDPKSVPEASDILARTQAGQIQPPSSIIASTPEALDAIVMKALSGSPAARFQTAREMAVALEDAGLVVPNRLVGDWVAQVAGDALREKAIEMSEVEGVELTAVSVKPPHVPLTSFIDLAAFSSASMPPTDAGTRGDELLKGVARPPRLPQAAPTVSKAPMSSKAPLKPASKPGSSVARYALAVAAVCALLLAAAWLLLFPNGEAP